ncbi:MAG: Asp-tRNA(Asn)/Glu-tRNA(Gln) amidotransferase subunit GatA [Nanohaloarchaea archaeon]|nr:Asp-tRNA(Asn)/Glu-tRNA(Gln) amidotransferase subunit GatA [Candidatus Nanohaloarchaea archaeon]
MQYSKMSVSDFIDASKNKNIDMVDFYSKFFEETEKIQKKYNHFVTISKNDAEKNIKKINKKTKLKGLPLSVKDNICTKGIQSTAGSKILENYIPPFDATPIAHGKKEGGIIIGKTVQDEFGFGTFSTYSAYGIPKNPIDPKRSCGGSSGGAGGFTKAIDMPHIAIGESTGGSISCPAAFCGIVGLTPTYGRVSRYGLIDYANSLDKIGPMAKTVKDTALMLSIISGNDPLDQTSIQKNTEDFTKYTDKDIKGMRIGIPKEYFNNIDRDVEKKVRSAIEKLEELGAKTVDITLSTTEYALPAYYIIATVEASTNLAKYSGMRYGAQDEIKGHYNEYFSAVRGKYLGDEAKRRVILGTYARMAGYRDQYYLKALKVRTKIIEDFKKAFNKVDVLAAPTMPIIAPQFKDIEKLTPVETYAMDTLTVGPNLAGIPMISIPCGTSKDMPVGLHLLGDHLEEGKIIQVADAFEKI